MSRETGRSLSEIEHLKQSVVDILSTPIGSRVMRRGYGSRLFDLIDAPLNRATLIDLYAAVAEALAKWEDRITVQQVDVTSSQIGQITLAITGIYNIDGNPLRLDGIVIKK
ncbi:baseplate assembly protein W [Acinetobacter sp. ANC 4910]|nr:baseplate assembly protein W [Acinetobacter sp. ANC 4910]